MLRLPVAFCNKSYHNTICLPSIIQVPGDSSHHVAIVLVREVVSVFRGVELAFPTCEHKSEARKDPRALRPGPRVGRFLSSSKTTLHVWSDIDDLVRH